MSLPWRERSVAERHSSANDDRPARTIVLVLGSYLGCLRSLRVVNRAFWGTEYEGRVRGRVRLWERLRGRRSIGPNADFIGIEAIDQSGQHRHDA